MRDSFARQWKLISVLGISVLLGGGGAPHPLQNMAVQVICLAIAVWPIKGRSGEFSLKGIDRFLIVLVGLTVVFPLVQLVRVPPAVWSVLPGRAAVQTSLQIIGKPDAWMPWSVDPARTLLAWLSLIPAVVALVLAARAPTNDRIAVLIAVLMFGLLEVVLGAVQLASGNRVLMLYQKAASDQLQGTFAYHNAIGIFLVICLIILVGLPRRGRDRRADVAIRLGLGTVFTVAVVLTQSRTSMALLVLPAALLILTGVKSWLDRSGMMDRHVRQRLLVGIPIGIACLAAFAWVAAGNQRVNQALSRFDDLHDSRPMIWEDAWTTTKAYWPVGTGMGTFMTAFNIHESLENLVPPITNRAHNDYLELSIEGGLSALLLLAGWAAFVLLRVTGEGAGIRNRSLRAITLVATLAIAGQSLIDYPLRNEAMLALAGLLLGLLSKPMDTKEISVEA